MKYAMSLAFLILAAKMAATVGALYLAEAAKLGSLLGG